MSEQVDWLVAEVQLLPGSLEVEFVDGYAARCVADPQLRTIRRASAQSYLPEKEQLAPIHPVAHILAVFRIRITNNDLRDST